MRTFLATDQSKILLPLMLLGRAWRQRRIDNVAAFEASSVARKIINKASSLYCLLLRWRFQCNAGDSIDVTLVIPKQNKVNMAVFVCFFALFALISKVNKWLPRGNPR